jgi:deoxyhypusine synthase
MKNSRENIEKLYQALSGDVKEMLDKAISSIISAKKKGGKIVVVTGSGPNIHEGVTTLIAELIHKDIIDGVTTSSAVIAHEMGGVLEEVRRVDGIKMGLEERILPRGNIFEVNLMQSEVLDQLKKEMIIDEELINKALSLDGDVIIKAAGNMAYPLGLRSEVLAKEIMFIAQSRGVSFEEVAGAGSDRNTMLGAAYEKGIPVLVTIPQLVGGGMVGLAIGDSISIIERSTKIAQMMESADVIIESAVALTQEIHDGPFETYTGHGIWSHWEGYPTYSLKDKTLVRIDLDPTLKKAWDFDKQSGKVQAAIDKGLPKTKMMSIPFRMEMSGFARLEKSIPVVSDLGSAWPIIAYRIEQELDISLDFMSYPQQSPEGKEMRKWIVDNIKPIEKKKLYL